MIPVGKKGHRKGGCVHHRLNYKAHRLRLLGKSGNSAKKWNRFVHRVQELIDRPAMLIANIVW